MDKREFLLHVREKAALKNVEEAETASRAVMHALRERLTPEEAHDLESQFSMGEKELWEESEIQQMLEGMHLAKRGVTKMHKNEFLQRVQREASGIQDAEKMSKAVFSTVKQQVSEGEIQDVASQLPEDLKGMWLEA